MTSSNVKQIVESVDIVLNYFVVIRDDELTKSVLSLQYVS